MKFWDIVGLSISTFILIAFIYYQIGHMVK
jgi:hypothetical protein